MEERTAAERRAQQIRMATQNKMRNDAAMKWVAAINTYRVATAATALGTDFPGTSDLTVEHKNGSTQITLDNSRGVPINPMNSMTPATGWTAKRFTETSDKSRGVIITNLGPAATETESYGYVNFFYDNTAATIAKRPGAITGVTPGRSGDGVLTFTRKPLNKPIKIGHARCWVAMRGIYPLKRTNRRQKWC